MGGATRSRRFPVVLGLCALFAAGLIALLASVDTPDPASAATDGSEMALNVTIGGLCDDPVQPTACTVNPGSKFTLSIDAISIPANGYILAQAWVSYGDDFGAVKHESVPWPDCNSGFYLTQNSDEDDNVTLDSYYAGCLTGGPPSPVSTYEGSLFTLGLTCPVSGGTQVIELLPSGAPPANTNGTAFTDADGDTVIPKVNPLTINCQLVTPPPDGTPTNGIINGTLYESQSGFMRGATVSLEPLGIHASTSDQDGYFTLVGVPNDKYTIVVVSGCSYVGCYTPYPLIYSGEKISVSIYPKPFDGDTDGDSIPNSSDPNDDNDSCTDAQELGPDETLGGRRNPHNPNDFYDVNGDGIIDLPNDILGVIQHFSPSAAPPYDVLFDRGPSSGPNPWNMTAPDGVIDLPNDILGVILQFGHSCA